MSTALVLVTDPAAVQTESHPPLAVTTLTREECVNEGNYRELTEFGREFCTPTAGPHDVHANLSVGDLGFEEYAPRAHGDPDRFYPSF